MNLRAWVSTSHERPSEEPPAAAWEEVGWVDTATEDDLSRYVQGVLGLRAAPRARSVLFYLSADPDASWTANLREPHADVERRSTAPGETFWLALENSGPGGATVVSTAPAVLAPQKRRPPETHPAMHVRAVQIGVKAKAGAGLPVVEKLR